MGDFSRGVQQSKLHWQHRAAPGASAARMELGAFDGTIMFANGETAIFVGVESIDLSQDDEPFSGTIVALLPDGSVSHQQFSGRLTFRGTGGRIGGTGEWAFLRGSGRFAGLSAGGGMDWTIEADIWRAEFYTHNEP